MIAIEAIDRIEIGDGIAIRTRIAHAVMIVTIVMTVMATTAPTITALRLI
jgi:hypothetical protein